MKMNIRRAVLMIVLLGTANAPAQEQAVALPDSPVGKAFAAMLQAIETGEHEKYIRTYFAERLFERFTMQDHLDFFGQMQRMHGGFAVTDKSIKQATEYEFVAVVKSKNRDAWRRFELAVAPEPPHKLVSLGVDMAEEPSGEPPLPAMTGTQILEYVQQDLTQRAENDAFSGAILIAQNGQPLLQQAYGMASKEFSVPNKIDTKFNIGSINKSFTQMAIAQLLEAGKIALDDPLSKYRPDFPKQIAEKVTIWHLLTMRSGMGSYWNDEWQAKWATIKTVEDLISIIKKVPLDFEPGTRRQYSNSGYVVLGAIIEKVTGQSYYDYIRERVYQPAGMHNTDAYELDQIVPNLARGYTQNRSKKPYKAKVLQNNLFLHSVKGSPAGGGFSTLGDLNRYIEALKNNTLAGEKYTNLALGRFEDDGSGESRPSGIGIAGGAPVGINAALEADFESGYTVIVLSNYDPPGAEEVALKSMRMLLRQKKS